MDTPEKLAKLGTQDEDKVPKTVLVANKLSEFSLESNSLP
jgi:hypothetical protein